MWNWLKSLFVLPPQRTLRDRLHPKWKPGNDRNPITGKTDYESIKSDFESVLGKGCCISYCACCGLQMAERFLDDENGTCHACRNER